MELLELLSVTTVTCKIVSNSVTQSFHMTLIPNPNKYPNFNRNIR